MEMCYDGALVMPSNYAVMSEDEMTYVDGGGAQSFAEALFAGLIVAALSGQITKASVIGALKACAGAAKACWVAIKAAAAFVWNTPAALLTLGVAVGVGIGVVCTYYGLKKKKKK